MSHCMHVVELVIFQLCVWWSLLMEKLYETGSRLPHCFLIFISTEGTLPQQLISLKTLHFQTAFFSFCAV